MGNKEVQKNTVSQQKKRNGFLELAGSFMEFLTNNFFLLMLLLFFIFIAIKAIDLP